MRKTKYICPHCNYVQDESLAYALEECLVCNRPIDTKSMFVEGLIDDLKRIHKEVASIKRWLKGRNIPIQTKDELRRRLNQIVSQK